MIVVYDLRKWSLIYRDGTLIYADDEVSLEVLGILGIDYERRELQPTYEDELCGGEIGR